MHKSRVSTIKVPVISGPPTGPNVAPAVIVEKAGYDLNVIVRNLSFGSYVSIAYDAAALQTATPKADSYRLPAGERDHFVVTKGQSLLVSTPSGGADGEGVLISFHIYEALPVDSDSD